MSRSAYQECEAFLRRLPDLVDREHAPEDEPALRDHLARCEHCLQLYQFERRFLDDVRANLAQCEIPTSLRHRIGAMIARVDTPGKSAT